MSTNLDDIDSSMEGIEDRVNENFTATSPAGAFAYHAALSSALHLALYEGISPLTGNQVAAYEVDLTASTTHYVQLNRDDTVTKTTSAPAGWPHLADGAWAIGVAVAGTSTFTWTDYRRFGAPPILGFPYTYSSTTSSADPGSGTLRLNNTTLSSATALYISETDGLGRAIAALIAFWDDGAATNKSQLTVSKTSDPVKFAVYNVTGTNTDNGAWDTVNLTYVTGSGSLANGDAVTVTVMPTGAAGAGDVSGPGSSVDGDVVLFDGTTGKLIKSAGFAPAIVRLAQVVTAALQTTVDFSSIPSVYTTLFVEWLAQENNAGTAGSLMRVMVNNDGTAANYTSSGRGLFVNDAAVLSSSASATNGVSISGIAQSGNTNIASGGRLTIVGYAQTTFHKRLVAVFGSDDATNNNNGGIYEARWKSTAAINQLTFGLNTANGFSNGSIFTLYGVR